MSPAREGAPQGGGRKKIGLAIGLAVGCLFLLSLSSSTSTNGLGAASLASPSGTATRSSRRLLNAGEGEECARIGDEGGMREKYARKS